MSSCERRREGGELRPKGPTEGKAKPGMTFIEAKDRRDFEPTNCVNETCMNCVIVKTESVLRGLLPRHIDG